MSALRRDRGEGRARASGSTFEDGMRALARARSAARSGSSPTRCASGCTATARTSTSTCGSRSRTCAAPRASSARSRSSRKAHARRAHDDAREAWQELRASIPSRADRAAHGQRPASRAAVRVVRGAAARLQARATRTCTSSASPASRSTSSPRIRHDAYARCSTRLRAAGLGSLPGGGAEIFAHGRAPRIAPDKADGRAVPRGASRRRTRSGMRTNCTMLYGHIETFEHRVDHMLRLRALQDETRGFQCFIPLAFHTENNSLQKLPEPTAVDDLRTHRRQPPAARQHRRTSRRTGCRWASDVAQIALRFGADDLDGTIVHETHLPRRPAAACRWA